MAPRLSFTTEVSADVNAITGDGAEVILKQSAVQDLSDSLRGRLLLRGDDGYDKARRILEPSFDKYHGLIVQLGTILQPVVDEPTELHNAY